MATEQQLAFADSAGAVWAREYGLPPVTGRVLGYLAVCDPGQQTIADLAEALLASRSAITAAVKELEGLGAVQRRRAAGERLDRVSLNPAAALEPRGFDPAGYERLAGLAREGLGMIKHADPQRRALLAEAAELYEFLAARMPELLAEWRARRARMRAAAELLITTGKEER
jgi:DNA-binding transcriptional ArsR family regulator